MALIPDDIKVALFEVESFIQVKCNWRLRGPGTATYEVMELLFNQPSSTAIKIENVFLLPTKQKFKFSSPQVFKISFD